MAKLSILLCVVLLSCVVLSSARGLRGLKRGSGGASQGNRSQGGTSGSSSESSEITPITKDEFKSELQDFVDVFTDASENLEKLEEKLAVTQDFLSDFKQAYLTFLSVTSPKLLLVPVIKGLGTLLERIAESPDEFPPLPYCDSSANLAAGKTTIITSLQNATELALREDLSCFKGKLLKVTAIDVEAFAQPEFTELQAIEACVTIVKEVIQLDKGLEHFGEALEELEKQLLGQSSKRSHDNESDLKRLVHLLRELKLDERR